MTCLLKNDCDKEYASKYLFNLAKNTCFICFLWIIYMLFQLLRFRFLFACWNHIQIDLLGQHSECICVHECVWRWATHMMICQLLLNCQDIAIGDHLPITICVVMVKIGPGKNNRRVAIKGCKKLSAILLLLRMNCLVLPLTMIIYIQDCLFKSYLDLIKLIGRANWPSTIAICHYWVQNITGDKIMTNIPIKYFSYMIY